jgi:hypothetical protein
MAVDTQGAASCFPSLSVCHNRQATLPFQAVKVVFVTVIHISAMTLQAKFI